MAIYNALGTTSVVETHGVAPEVTRLYRDLDDAEQRLGQLVRLGGRPRLGNPMLPRPANTPT